jgi:hypothetical protein
VSNFFIAPDSQSTTSSFTAPHSVAHARWWLSGARQRWKPDGGDSEASPFYESPAPKADAKNNLVKLRSGGEQFLVGIRSTTFDRRNTDYFVLLIKLIQDAPIANPSTKRAVEAPKEFNAAPERIFAHF